MLLEPQPVTDTFCSCPSCGSLGHHITKTHPYTHFGDGTSVCPKYPRPGSLICVIRTCFSCGEQWTRDAQLNDAGEAQPYAPK